MVTQPRTTPAGPPVHPGAASAIPAGQRLVPNFSGAFRAIELVEQLLEQFTNALETAKIPYAVVGGYAVAACVAAIDSGATRYTKDVDVLVRRSDLPRVTVAAEGIELVRGDDNGMVVFMRRSDTTPRRGVHVILAGERIRPGCSSIAPDIATSCRSSQGYTVINLPELLRMKLEAYRRHDQVHLEDMLRVGLIDAELAARLPTELLDRLRHVRDTMEWSTEPPKF